MELDERKEKILKAIIQTYLETGEPVGSRTISKYSGLKLSSATIRNEMSDLEELGYIIQPHTSAGRIPSDKGYRFYVDQIIQEKDSQVNAMQDMMIQRVDRVELLLKQMAQILASNTNYATMVSGPNYHQTKLKFIQLSRVEANKLLIVVVVEGNIIRNSFVTLDEELSNQPGFKKPPTKIVRKCRTTSQTDPDSGYINHGSKRGIGYLMEATVDCKHGILTGVDVYSANEKESVLILRHLERQINLGIPMSRLALDRGYETGAVHRGLELLGITGYIPAIQFSNPPEKYGFSYDPQLNAFICPEGVPLTYHRLNCSKSTGKYLRCYQVEGDACMRCPKRPGCFDKAGIRRRVLASSCYPAFFRGHQRVGTPEYLSMMRLRKIWAEVSFSVLKREHCISKIRKRGILAATEECLLAAMALNLKRMAKCHLSLSPNLLFC